MARPPKQPTPKENENLEFAQFVANLGELGMAQKEVADYLGISEGQLSRVKRGEREASLKHIRALRRLVETRRLDLRPTRKRLPFFSINQNVLADMLPAEAIRAFRDLLWARAASLGVPRTKVSVSEDINVADGGVDASIFDDAGVQDDLLLTTGTRFQVKAGEAKPWQPSWVKKEFFKNNKSQTVENLGPAIRDCLNERRRYVLVCFGVDLLDDKLRKAVKNLRAEFAKCGYPDAQVEVWGQTQLIGLFHQYPSLCLRLLGHDQLGFQTHDTWSRNADMLPTLRVSPEQQALIDELGRLLLAGEIAHIRLIGEAGVGKTRLALEATRGELAPVVLYFSDGGQFQRNSGFINELIQPDDDRFVVLVIDECGPKDRSSIWNVLKTRAKKVRLITIDHGPDDSAGDDIRVIDIPSVGDEQLIAILVDHGVPAGDAERWAEFCEGCPRVAHVVGENLSKNRSDLLQSPAEINVWDRFIIGQDDPSSQDVQLRKIVLRHISLFERFGFGLPVHDEAEFIAKICGAPVTVKQFDDAVVQMRQRRVLQGATTLYLAPRLLHVYLYRDFWERHGRSLDIAALLRSMPQQLWHWFVGMLRYAHMSPVAEAAVDELLGPSGIFPGSRFPDTREDGKLIMMLAETNPKPALKCLKRTIGSYGEAELRQLTGARQSIIWALEGIAAFNDSFQGAAELLLALAESDFENSVGHAARSFTESFSLIPGMAATEAPPSRRLPILTDALNSDCIRRREIALGACKCALSTHGGFRTVGPEHQGLRKTITFWMPKTYEELWDAHRAVWQLLVDKLTEWKDDQRRQLIDTLIDSAWSTLHISPLTSTVLSTLESVADDPMTDVKALVTFAKRQLQAKDCDLSEDTTSRLHALCARLDGHDFVSKLQRFVRNATWEDSFDDNRNTTGLVDQKIEELAEEAINAAHLLASELPWLIGESSSPAFAFAFKIGKRDPERRLLPELLKYYVKQGENASHYFLGGYLRSICDDDPGEWEKVLLELADHPVISHRFSDFAIVSGMSDAVARKVVELCRSGIQQVELLENWWFAPQLRQLGEEVLLQIVNLQLESGRGRFWRNAVQMYHTYYLHGGCERCVPEQMTFALLTHQSMAEERYAQSIGYYWSQLAAEFIDQYPERTWEFFGRILRAGTTSWSILSDLDTNHERILLTILKRNPERAWDEIAEVYKEIEDRELWGIYRWLSDGGHRMIGNNSPGPIRFMPAPRLFAWADQDPEDRAAWLAGLMPKTLDQTQAGRLTRDFIAKYGKSRRVAESLWANFHSRGWCGSESDHYRKLRDEARLWQVEENNSTVFQWVEDYIGSLDNDIKRAEINEERRFV